VDIIYFSSTTLPGYSANSLQIIKMCEAFGSIGHRITLINFDHFSKKLIDPIVPVYDFYGVSPTFSIIQKKTASSITRTGLAIGLIQTLLASLVLILRKRPTLVFGRYLPPLLISAILGTPVILETHYPLWKSRVNRFFFRLLLKTNNLVKVVVISESLKKSYLKFYGNKLATIIQVLPDAASTIKDNEIKDHELSTSRDNLVIGYAGSFHQGKGVDLIFDLARLLPTDQFSLIGQHTDEMIIALYGADIPKNITLHGFVTQKHLAPLLEKFDIALLPIQDKMYGEGHDPNAPKNLAPFTSPLKMFQYMAHGKAIISSDLPALREVLDDTCAFFAPPTDVKTWAEKINLLRNPDIRKKLGQRAKYLQQTYYSWEARASAAVKLSI
jgi:glycosyltransferase involved in cell wall biosynthesis